jgi:hypothetical protein
MWTAGGWRVEIMSLLRHVCCLAFVVGAGILQAGDGTGAAAWQPLFNGKDLSGWVKMSDGSFSATNGVIRLDGGKGWLRTERQFTDFVLEVEGRGLETNYNSGIFIRAPSEGKPWATNVWQVNLKQNAIGDLLEGSIRLVPSKLPAKPVGEWTKFRIEARGRSVSLDVDGQRVWDFKEFTPARGFIGLQAEGKSVEFRNLRIGVLPTVDAPVLR